MQVIETIADMREVIAAAKRAGKRIGLVPTMGSLHEGHLTLMRQAKAECDLVVASVFVNPIQFGPNEDFAVYPRDLAGDSEKAQAAGVDYIFHPAVKEMYPTPNAAFVNVERITDKLCGQSRPGHFRGVATVVTKLFNIVTPDAAYFGQKDAQQALVIHRMAADLNMTVAINIVPIVREADGLALSSRNVFLSAAERQAALVLSRSLNQAQQLVFQGERDIAVIRQHVVGLINSEPLAKTDYVEILSYPDLGPLTLLESRALLALAVKFGTTRLIDNTILEVVKC